MLTPIKLVAVCLAALLAAPQPPKGNGTSLDDSDAVRLTADERAVIVTLSPLPQPPPDPTNAVADNPAAARLGQWLFFERGFSADGSVSCATCHDPARGFADGKPLGHGIGDSQRHTAALWNVAHNRWYFWDGRADSLWAQALQPFESPTELASSRIELVRAVHADTELRTAYERQFDPMPPMSEVGRFPPAGRPVADGPDHPHNQAWLSMRPADRDAVTRAFVNLGKSIAAYERRIVSRESPFDRFVDALRRNDPVAARQYPAAAQRGLKLFIGRGNCRLCHSGPNFTDGEFHDTLLPTADGGPPSDPGRYRGAERVLADPFNALGVYSDARSGAAAAKIEFLANGPQNWGLFKTPTLRNVALTAPYMHHGRLETLRDVVVHYSTLPNARPSHHPERILVRLNLSDDEIDDLVAFLESLTGAPLDPGLLGQPPTP
jgi:cytochrome c peroxidase